MTTTQQQKRQTDRQILEELAALFATDSGAYVILLEVRRLLVALGLSAALALWLSTLTAGGNAPGELGVPSGPCQVIEEEHAKAWLAMYLVAAASRLMEAEQNVTGPGLDTQKAQDAEERYYQLHRAAEERRQRAAALQDMAAKLNVDREPPGADELAEVETQYLGWRAVIDERTTLECRAANGMNFKADRMPLIGWPGAVHMRCRCSAGPAVPGAPVMPSI